MAEPRRARSGRLLTRYERQNGEYDPDDAVAGLNDAYLINGKPRPHQLHWCELCIEGWPTEAELIMHRKYSPAHNPSAA